MKEYDLPPADFPKVVIGLETRYVLNVLEQRKIGFERIEDEFLCSSRMLTIASLELYKKGKCDESLSILRRRQLSSFLPTLCEEQLRQTINERLEKGDFNYVENDLFALDDFGNPNRNCVLNDCSAGNSC